MLALYPAPNPLVMLLFIFGVFFASLLYKNFGGGIWPFWTYLIGYFLLWGKYGTKSGVPHLILTVTAIWMEVGYNLLSNRYKHMLAGLDPETARWLALDCSGGEGFWCQIPSYFVKYSGFQYLKSLDFNHVLFGFTLPEILVMLFSTCALLGLLVALVHEEKLSTWVSTKLHWQAPEGGILYWFLYIPYRFPQWTAMPLTHHGWRAGVLLIALPVTSSLVLVAIYLFLVFVLFLYLPLRIGFYLWGIDLEKVFGKSQTK